MLLYTTVVTIKVKSILGGGGCIIILYSLPFFSAFAHFCVVLILSCMCPFLHKYTERKEAGVKFLVYRYLANKADFVSENFDSGKKKHSQPMVVYKECNINPLTLMPGQLPPLVAIFPPNRPLNVPLWTRLE